MHTYRDTSQINHCQRALLCYSLRPFVGQLAGENGLQFRVRVDVGGHNNIEINPEFRGMP